MSRYKSHYAFICSGGAEWCIIKVKAYHEADAWNYAAIQASKLGYDGEATIKFLGFVA